MELSNTELDNWANFKKQSVRDKAFPERDEKIIQLSKDGVPLKKIQKIVGGTYGHIGEVRMKARREGLF